MFVILLSVALASGFLGQPEQSAVIIIIIIGISVALGFYNEFRAARLVEELQGRTSVKAMVTRSGKTSELDSSSIVPGDLLNVYIGDIVAADARIISSKELEVDESVLTGSFATEKNPQTTGGPASNPNQATDMLFMGTAVLRGVAARSLPPRARAPPLVRSRRASRAPS
jgi:Mg2+-importing ATPase